MDEFDYDDLIPRMLERCRTIAVVGLSTDPQRDSHHVARYMQSHGYRIVPVNPTYAGTTILGERCHASLHDAAEQMVTEGGQIDMVDCFPAQRRNADGCRRCDRNRRTLPVDAIRCRQRDRSGNGARSRHGGGDGSLPAGRTRAFVGAR